MPAHDGRLNPHTWIDEQRRAGSARGNIFADIIEAAAQYRAQRGDVLTQFEARRAARVRADREALRALSMSAGLDLSGEENETDWPRRRR